jgi:hypothetical protein
MNEVIAEGYAFDPTTREWTQRAEYRARNRAEALYWINFNAAWMKHLRIVEPDSFDGSLDYEERCARTGRYA